MGTSVKCVRMDASLEFVKKIKTLLFEKADRIWSVRFTLPMGCNYITHLRNVKHVDTVGFSSQYSLFLCSSFMALQLA